MMIAEGLLTIAFGADKYVRMAEALSRSYRRLRPSRAIAVVTDKANEQRLAAAFDQVISLDPALGSGVVQKLFIDRYSPFQRTLFVDSDCLFYKNPQMLWESYAQGPFVVRGWEYLTGGTEKEASDPYFWVEDMVAFLRHAGIHRMGSFNSGVVYFDRSSIAHAVFEEARDIYVHREGYGFKAFKNADVADEPVLAVAMERHGVEMLPWAPARGMETAIGMTGSRKLNVLKGKARIRKSGEDRDPVLLHFNVDAQHNAAYQRDMARLRHEGSPFFSLLVLRDYARPLLKLGAQRALSVVRT